MLPMPNFLQTRVPACVLLNKTIDVNAGKCFAHFGSLLKGFHRCHVINQLNPAHPDDHLLSSALSTLMLRLTSSTSLNLSYKNLLATEISEDVLRTTIDELTDSCGFTNVDPDMRTLKSFQQSILRFVVSPWGAGSAPTPAPNETISEDSLLGFGGKSGAGSGGGSAGASRSSSLHGHTASRQSSLRGHSREASYAGADTSFLESSGLNMSTASFSSHVPAPAAALTTLLAQTKCARDDGDDTIFRLMGISVARALLQRMSFAFELLHIRFDSDRYERVWRQMATFMAALTRAQQSQPMRIKCMRDPFRSFLPASVLWGPLCDPVCVRAIEFCSQVSLDALNHHKKLSLPIVVCCFGMGHTPIDSTVTECLKQLSASDPPEMIALGFCSLVHFAKLIVRQLWLDLLKESLPESSRNSYTLLSCHSNGVLALYIFALPSVIPRVRRIVSSSVGDDALVTRINIDSSTINFILSEIPDCNQFLSHYNDCIAAASALAEASCESFQESTIWLGRHAFSSSSSPRSHPLHRFVESSRPSYANATEDGLSERIFHHSIYSSLEFESVWAEQCSTNVRAVLWRGSFSTYIADHAVIATSIHKLKSSFGPLPLNVVAHHPAAYSLEKVQQFLTEFGQIVCFLHLGGISLFTFATFEVLYIYIYYNVHV